MISDDETVTSITPNKAPTTKITIHGYVAPEANPSQQTADAQNHSQSGSTAPQPHEQKESVLLSLHPPTQVVASEWLDGLLMLLNQQPITAETSKLINMVSSYGLKIRLLNVKFDERDMLGERPPMPSREGLDDDYYYDVFGGQ